MKIDPDRQSPNVLTEPSRTVPRTVQFRRPSFGQPVVMSDVIAVIHRVAGVVAVDLEALYRTDAPPQFRRRSSSRPPSIRPGSTPPNS